MQILRIGVSGVFLVRSRISQWNLVYPELLRIQNCSSPIKTGLTRFQFTAKMGACSFVIKPNLFVNSKIVESILFCSGTCNKDSCVSYQICCCWDHCLLDLFVLLGNVVPSRKGASFHTWNRLMFEPTIFILRTFKPNLSSVSQLVVVWLSLRHRQTDTLTHSSYNILV